MKCSSLLQPSTRVLSSSIHRHRSLSLTGRQSEPTDGRVGFGRRSNMYSLSKVKSDKGVLRQPVACCSWMVLEQFGSCAIAVGSSRLPPLVCFLDATNT